MQTPTSSESIPVIPYHRSQNDQLSLAGEHYRASGILYLKGFYAREELRLVHTELVEAEVRATKDLERNWNAQKVTFYTNNPIKAVSAKNTENFVVTPYFQASAEKTHLFFEEIDDTLTLNRMGHGLHLDPENKVVYESIYASARLKALLRSVGYVNPLCLLSIYIPKHPHGHGSEVKPHQESTFATTNPLSASVLWVALEDATIENACMWGLPGSHQLPLKFVSKVDHDRKTREYVQIHCVDVPEFRESEHPYVPLEVKAGDALFFHGNFVHCSPRNTSSRSRKALSFQFIESHETEFLSHNWIRNLNRKPIV